MVNEIKDLTDELAPRKNHFTFGSTSYESLDFLSLRIRQIINIDVPHAGGNKIKTRLGGTLYDYILWPIFKSIRLLSIGKFKTGYNKIVRQLGYRGEYVNKLENDYNSI